MSPTESQLRAALHDGEGDVPDADRAIARALRIRRERRTRYLAVAGAAAAAAVVGVGTTVLIALSGGNDSGSSSSADKRAASNNAAVVAGGAASASSSAAASAESRPGAVAPSKAAASDPRSVVATRAATALHCPAVADRFMVPGGGGSGQFGSTDALFTGATALRLCAYPAGAGTTVRSAVIGPPEAASITRAIDAAPATRTADHCAPDADYAGGRFEILAVNALGDALKPVVITLGCTVNQATNGTALRYAADLPQRFYQLLMRPVSPGTARRSTVR